MVDGVVDPEEEAAEYIGENIVENGGYLSHAIHIELYPDKDTENRGNGNAKSGYSE